jgi:hypothetical protein
LSGKDAPRASDVRETGSQPRAGTSAGKVVQIARDLGSACPYTALGKKALKAMKSGRSGSCDTGTGKARDLVAVVKTGRAIALIGCFCPIFWVSLLSGVRGPQLRFNAIHSGVVIVIGLVVMARGKIALARELRGRSGGGD